MIFDWTYDDLAQLPLYVGMESVANWSTAPSVGGGGGGGVGGGIAIIAIGSRTMSVG